MPFKASGLAPDPKQAAVLCGQSKRVLMNCCRQWGKSTTAAALGVREAILYPRSLVLVFSPSERQSAETLRKACDFNRALGRPVPAVRENVTCLELANGSRVVGLPSVEESVRGFSGPRLVILDEASRVPDSLYRAVRPMLARSGGRLVALSTPFGRRGWFWEAWSEGGPGWERHTATIEDCPWADPAMVEEDRKALGPDWFGQEYLGVFLASTGGIFDAASILGAVRGGAVVGNGGLLCEW